MIGKYYKNIENCPLSVFIKVLIYSDVNYLTMSGWPLKRELEDAWEEIFDQYLRENDEQKYKILLRNMKDLAMMHNRAKVTNSILKVLKLKYHKGLIGNLRMLGYRYKFDPQSKNYFQDLEKVQADVKKQIVTVEEKEAEMRKKTEREIKEKDFDSMLVEFSRFQGYRLNKEEITVSEFLSISKNYKRANKPNKPVQNGK